MERKTDHLEDGESILEDFLKESMACLAQEDEQVGAWLHKEYRRQQENIELIA